MSTFFTLMQNSTLMYTGAIKTTFMLTYVQMSQNHHIQFAGKGRLHCNRDLPLLQMTPIETLSQMLYILCSCIMELQYIVYKCI